MSWAQVVVWAAGTAVILGAGGGLIKVGRALWVGLRRVSRLLDDLQGEPPRPGFSEGRPGLLVRLELIEKRFDTLPTREEVAALRERLAAVEAQLIPNGGGSLRDTVDRVAVTVGVTDE